MVSSCCISEISKGSGIESITSSADFKRKVTDLGFYHHKRTDTYYYHLASEFPLTGTDINGLIERNGLGIPVSSIVSTEEGIHRQLVRVMDKHTGEIYSLSFPFSYDEVDPRD